MTLFLSLKKDLFSLGNHINIHVKIKQIYKICKCNWVTLFFSFRFDIYFFLEMLSEFKLSTPPLDLPMNLLRWGWKETES